MYFKEWKGSWRIDRQTDFKMAKISRKEDSFRQNLSKGGFQLIFNSYGTDRLYPPRDRLAVYCQEIGHAFLASTRIKLTSTMNSPWQKNFFSALENFRFRFTSGKIQWQKKFEFFFITPKDSLFNFRGSPQVIFWNNE